MIPLIQRKNGGTTVSATMFAAKLAKIPIFVTGGIGGVHREAAQSKINTITNNYIQTIADQY